MFRVQGVAAVPESSPLVLAGVAGAFVFLGRLVGPNRVTRQEKESYMSLRDFISKQFIDVIDWVEPEEINGISYFPKVDVLYRLNDAKEDKEQWTPSTDKTSASFSKNSLEKMLRAHTVEITAQDQGGAAICRLHARRRHCTE